MFNLLKIENANMNVPEPEYLFVKADEPVTAGEALVLFNGVLTKCDATTKPTYISMRALGAADIKRDIAVCRVEENQVYSVPVSAAPSSLKVGEKVTLGADGLTVTATTTSGVATIVDLNGAKASGDLIKVRFV